ncbi:MULTISPECIES: glycerol-3-phosphate dehydrogenase/oxidase [Paraliobacillus]|uniref:glycerol-3-phosphate dehydrogenase/oxidase n=1 Tax=Paraliobacillus TaxID=200903 RepID=UPI000DD4A3B2|nr:MULTISPECIES: glycerol-3-phosphate dehydrogenase/oxidase [Paraliobacillus]
MFSNIYRQEMCEALASESYDVFVIGGGITGAGIALDATSRGMRTALVDMQDFAEGTSSRSTKLIHGGLRYVEHSEAKVVTEVGKERTIVYENGPHLTKPETMLLPLYQKSKLTPIKARLALQLYDFLAGVKKQERHQMLSKKQTLEKEPLLQRAHLRGAGYYVEYKTDDARLTIEVVKKAVELGTKAMNYIKVSNLLYDETGKANGVELEDQITGETYQVFAKKIVNATGPWVDTIREMDNSKQEKSLHLTKGVHLVFDQKDFPLQQAIYFDHKDGKMIFAIPRDEKTYVGTTDTVYKGDIFNPTVDEADRTYLLEAIHHIFPTLQVDEMKIESSWAGLRPLIAKDGKDPSSISRKDEIFVSPSGLISIAGGKLIAYRKMAENVVDEIVKQFKQEIGILYSKSDTKRIPISGGDVNGSKGFTLFKQEQLIEIKDIEIDKKTKIKYIDRYGSNVVKIWEYYRNFKAEALRYGVDPIVFSELVYSLQEECIYKPQDFFIRRTGALLFDITTVKRNARGVLDYLQSELYWNSEERAYYHRELMQGIKEMTNHTNK